jgi:hypothetical protein
VDHPVAGCDQSAHQRFPVFAFSGPGARSKHSVGDFPQARPGVARIDGLQCEQPSGQLHMRSCERRRLAKRAHRRQLLLDTIVIGQFETKRDRPSYDGAIDHVEPDDLAVMVDYKMLAARPYRHAHISRQSIEQSDVAIRWLQGPYGEHARFNGGRPDRQN